VGARPAAQGGRALAPPVDGGAGAEGAAAGEEGA